MLSQHHISEKKIIRNRQGNVPESLHRSSNCLVMTCSHHEWAKYRSSFTSPAWLWDRMRVRWQLYTSCYHEHRCLGFHSQPSVRLCVFQHLWLPKGWERQTEEIPNLYSGHMNYKLSHTTHIIKVLGIISQHTELISLSFHAWFAPIPWLAQGNCDGSTANSLIQLWEADGKPGECGWAVAITKYGLVTHMIAENKFDKCIWH